MVAEGSANAPPSEEEASMKSRKTRSFILFLLFAMVVLAWLLFSTWRDWQDWRESEGWPSTTSSSFAINHKSSRVRYTYLVKNQEYTSSRARFFERLLYEGIGDLEWQQAHRDATEVMVYYDPEHPERSVLVREVESERVLMLLLTLVYCGLALLLPFFLIGLSFWTLRHLFRG